jgi:Ca-activated chloride channel family protein
VTSFRFLHPALAWWMLAAAAALLWMRSVRRRRLGAAVATPWLFAPPYRASVVRRLPVAVFALAILLLVCALMEPVLPFAVTTVRSHGLDIVIVLDLSSSMQERIGGKAAEGRGIPFKSRLDATKDAIRTFVHGRVDDRVGLVVFSDNAYVITPLTFDREALTRYVEMIDGQMLRGEGMTAIGDGLALANQLLARQAAVPGARNKVIVLFTDGENNIGRQPDEVLAESESAAVRVHLVTIDLEAEARRKPQVQSLVRAVSRYGGKYFDAHSAGQLTAASRAIDTLEKGVLVSQTFERDAPVFEWFAAPALVCLMLGFVLQAIPAFIDQT